MRILKIRKGVKKIWKVSIIKFIEIDKISVLFFLVIWEYNISGETFKKSRDSLSILVDRRNKSKETLK